jgi:hypothetical protein
MTPPDDMPSERKFGFTIAVVLALLSALPLISGKPPYLWLVVPAIVLALFALAAPRLLSPLNRAWYRFGVLLHRIVNPLILAMLFFLVVTPVALLMKVAGKRLLQRYYEPESKTYWIIRSPPGPDVQSIRNQF